MAYFHREEYEMESSVAQTAPITLPHAFACGTAARDALHHTTVSQPGEI